MRPPADNVQLRVESRLPDESVGFRAHLEVVVAEVFAVAQDGRPGEELILNQGSLTEGEGSVQLTSLH